MSGDGPHWPVSELLASDGTGQFRRMVVDGPRLRFGAISFPPSSAIAEHQHLDSDEVYFVLSGSASISIEDEVFEAKPFDLLLIHARKRHSITVAASATEPFVILAGVAPNLDDAVLSADSSSALRHER